MGETHSQLIQKAVRWLKKDQGCGLVFAEMVTAAYTSPDVMGWRNGLSRLVEVKVSRSDFFADRKKTASVCGSVSMGTQRWYLTPQGLVEPKDLPEGWGLLHLAGRSIREVHSAPIRILDSQAYGQEAILLTSAVRRLLLGSRFEESNGRWETVTSRLAREQQQPNPQIGEGFE